MAHTQSMNNNLDDFTWDIVKEYLEDVNDSAILKVRDHFLDEAYYRPFAVRLLDTCNELLGESMSSQELKERILSGAKKKGIAFNRNTASNWLGLGDTREGPKHDEKGRENFFKLGFIFGLTVSQMITLMEKVYLERGMNRRNYREVVYYFALRKNEEYRKVNGEDDPNAFLHAEEIIARINACDEKQQPGDEMDSRLIQMHTDAMEDEGELEKFILNHWDEFIEDNTSAIRQLEELYEKASRILRRKTGTDQPKFRNQPYKREAILNAILPVHRSGAEDGTAGKRNREYREAILFFNRERKGKIPTELRTEFPNADNISKKDASSYILRKRLILLSFYCYFAGEEPDKQEEEFIDITNDFLDKSGYPLLYVSNPYDWFFLYCATIGMKDWDLLESYVTHQSAAKGQGEKKGLDPLDIFQLVVNVTIDED